MPLLVFFFFFFSLRAEFFPSLKRLLGTPVYCLFLCGSILRFNSIIGQITYTPKYMEQQFGVSTTRANFLLGQIKQVRTKLCLALAAHVDDFPNFSQALFAFINHTAAVTLSHHRCSKQKPTTQTHPRGAVEKLLPISNTGVWLSLG